LLAFKPVNAVRQPQIRILELKNEEARDLYGADLVLIRPDQIVAWRGNHGAEEAFEKITGRKAR
jgi:hypothetical protein